MIYLKLTKQEDLIVTVNEPIYRGEKLPDKLTFLIPNVVESIDMASAYVFLNVIRADGCPDIILLERAEVPYNASYLQYRIPLSCFMTGCPGKLTMWLHICADLSGDTVVAKSGECTLMVLDSKCMDEHLCDHQITAIYEMQKRLDTEMSTIPNGLRYNDDTRELQLTSDERALGNTVIVPADGYIANSDDVWQDMGGEPSDTGDTLWNDM